MFPSARESELKRSTYAETMRSYAEENNAEGGMEGTEYDNTCQSCGLWRACGSRYLAQAHFPTSKSQSCDVNRPWRLGIKIGPDRGVCQPSAFNLALPRDTD
jgi:hypothetical protein